MTEEERAAIIEAVDNMKKDHAREVLVKLDELTTLINSRGEIWSYGLPPALINIVNILSMQKKAIETDFNFTTMSTPVPLTST